jgi:hypothetical protein
VRWRLAIQFISLMGDIGRSIGKPAGFWEIAGMELRDLGFDGWFAESAREQCGTELSTARVTAVDRGRYVVRDEHGELPAALTGRLQFLAESSIDLPCVGDWVCVRYLDDRSHASIQGMLPRKSFLRRKAPGGDIDFQMIAANIDVAFVIQSCHFDFNVRRLERYLVMVKEGHIEPVLLLTKTDLVSGGELEWLVGEIRRAGIDAAVITVSNVTGGGPRSGSGAPGSRQDVLQAPERVCVPRSVVRRAAEERPGIRPVRAFCHEASRQAGRGLSPRDGNSRRQFLSKRERMP